MEETGAAIKQYKLASKLKTVSMLLLKIHCLGVNVVDQDK